MNHLHRVLEGGCFGRAAYSTVTCRSNGPSDESRKAKALSRSRTPVLGPQPSFGYGGAGEQPAGGTAKIVVYFLTKRNSRHRRLKRRSGESLIATLPGSQVATQGEWKSRIDLFRGPERDLDFIRQTRRGEPEEVGGAVVARRRRDPRVFVLGIERL